MTDFAEKMRMLAEAAHGRDGFGSMLNSLRHGFFIVNPRYDIEYVNPVIENDFGCYAGEKCFEYFCGRSSPCSRCATGQSFGREISCREWHSRKTNKTYRILDIPLRVVDHTASRLVVFYDAAGQRPDRDEQAPSRGYEWKGEEYLYRLLSLEDVTGDLSEVLEMLREVVGVNRACFLKNYFDSRKRICFKLVNAVAGQAMDPQMERCLTRGIPYANAQPSYKEELLKKDLFRGPITITSEDGDMLFSADSLLVAPLSIGNAWYGCISLSDDQPGREWKEEDVEFMRAAVKTITMHLDRECMTRDLVQKHTALKFASEYKRTISRAAKYLVSDTSIVNDIQKVLQLCIQEFQLHGVTIYVNDEESEGAGSHGSGMQSSTVIPGFQPLGNAPWSSVPHITEMVRRNHRYISHDLSELDEKDRARLNRNMMGALYIAELNVGGAPSGWISFAREGAYHWNRGEVSALSTITNMIANSWERYINANLRFTAERKQAEAVRIAEQASRLASVGALSSGIAHEINRPLSALKVIVDGMRYWRMRQHTYSEEEIFRSLDAISEQADKINDIVINMKTLSKRECGGDTVPFSINEVIRRVLVLVEERVSAAGIQVNLELDNELPLFQGYPIYIEQIVSNLVINAIQAMDQDSVEERAITIYTGFEQGSYHLRIRDTGRGIPKEVLPQLFQPFVSSKSPEGGMGLGLFVVRNVLNTMGGSITVCSDNGSGAVFSIIIPSRNA